MKQKYKFISIEIKKFGFHCTFFSIRDKISLIPGKESFARGWDLSLKQDRIKKQFISSLHGCPEDRIKSI